MSPEPLCGFALFAVISLVTKPRGSMAQRTTRAQPGDTLSALESGVHAVELYVSQLIADEIFQFFYFCRQYPLQEDGHAIEGFPHDLFFLGIIFPYPDEPAAGNYSIIVNVLHFGDACRPAAPVKHLGPLVFRSNKYSQASAEIKIIVADGKKSDRIRLEVRRLPQLRGVVLKKPDRFVPFPHLRLREAESFHGLLRLFLIGARPPCEFFDRCR